jgi:hypothetical protein
MAVIKCSLVATKVLSRIISNMNPAFTLTPDTSKIDRTTTLTATAIIVTRKNIGGTATIIVTIMIATTTEMVTGIKAPPICF